MRRRAPSRFDRILIAWRAGGRYDRILIVRRACSQSGRIPFGQRADDYRQPWADSHAERQAR